MFSREGEGGPGVVYGRLFPIRGIVTLSAVLSERTVVLVVLQVAGVAGSRRAF